MNILVQIGIRYPHVEILLDHEEPVVDPIAYETRFSMPGAFQMTYIYISNTKRVIGCCELNEFLFGQSQLNDIFHKKWKSF